ncbi:acetyltransferase (GNAT) family protein [Glaciihabitans tibetensis]|uniref:Acetyltransferase (GNAT) family protein n=1 Tax=Glaciihabitans tibetensis TaxID=1266600 RepID=A0A2T0VE29_9MICO|nr:GNAT family N-acetyltransferase [Glaciihabitans tibetensis]PRY68446.1 acetyltransferase (GNAT) family protein [Glaciihabitans tibetensis]
MSHVTESTFRLEYVAWDDPRALELRRVMVVEMDIRYSVPGRAGNSDEINRALAVDINDVRATLLAIDADGTPIGHAALRELNGELEVRRVVVSDAQRGRGVGRALMGELERFARDARAARLILQTGEKQPESVAMYENLGYTRIAVYQPYIASMPHSLCFEKVLA